MKVKRAIVDVSSLIWTNLQGGKDVENGRQVPLGDKTVQVNGWLYGYEKAIGNIKLALEDLGLTPRDLILVIEGMQSKALRTSIYQGYKAGREKAPEVYPEFTKARDAFVSALRALGAHAVSQDGIESDDVLGYLARNLRGTTTIISGDKDLAQCVVQGGGWDVHHWRAGVMDANPFGDFPHQFIPVYIALVGDPGDKISGAPGFGASAWNQMLSVFGLGALPAMEALIRERQLDKLVEDLTQMPKLQKIIDGKDEVYRSYELGRLHIDKVNTMRRPLQWQPGFNGLAPCDEPLLKQYATRNAVIEASNYARFLPWIKAALGASPFAALDVETSTPQESDDWLAVQKDGEGKDMVDVFGSSLTSIQITFGAAAEFTIYLPIDNVESERNLTLDQVKVILQALPEKNEVYVHNASFELPVVRREIDLENGHPWRGFLPNVVDTALMANYVDENESVGLKSLSKRLMMYDQVDYDTVTTKTYDIIQWNKRRKSSMGDAGTILDISDEQVYKVQHKMNQMTIEEVLDYGVDDTRVTAGLAGYFQIVMELEQTDAIFRSVEQFPAYLTAQAFLNGVPFNLTTMGQQQEDDKVAYDKAWATLRDYLINVGFTGTVFTPITEITPATLKDAFFQLTGRELETRFRILSKVANAMEEQAEGDSSVALLADAARRDDIVTINTMLRDRFKGEPVLDLGSTRQVAKLLYDVIGIPIRIVGASTEVERAKKPELCAALDQFSKYRQGKASRPNDEAMKLVRTKAKVDDTAIDSALAFDAHMLSDETRAALRAIGTMKTVMTRESLFYKNYWACLHWRDGRHHPSIRQSSTATRRYSAANNNVTQLPKKGEGVKFRGNFVPHTRLGVVCSADFSGQELRLSAENSQDKNLKACYVGDHLKDVHSITAAGAMVLKWGAAVVEEAFGRFGTGLSHDEEGSYVLFSRLRELGKEDPLGKQADDLRKSAKNVNFASIYGAKAPKLADTLIMPLEDAQLFLDSRNRMFPGLNDASLRAEEFCKQYGYAKTMLGARRHLRALITSDNRAISSRAARQAFNFEIQGSAAEQTKLSMARLWLNERWHQLDVEFWFPVHDELVWSSAIDDAQESLRIVNEAMTAQYAGMSIPVLSSLSLGPNFGTQIEVGDWYIPERISKAVEKIKKEYLHVQDQ